MSRKPESTPEAEYARCVTYKDNGKYATVTVKGDEYARLAAICDVLNSIGWHGGNSPDTMLEWLVGCELRDLCHVAKRDGMYCYEGVGNVVDNHVVPFVFTGFDCGTSEDRARRRELLDAFDRAGLRGKAVEA